MPKVYARAAGGIVEAMAKRKQDDASGVVDPDKLVRQTAGRYRTADGRFEVRDAGTGWFLVDTEQTNDFGQELLQGPFATLGAVREAIPPARSAKVTPLRPPKPAKGAKRGRTTGRERTPEPPPPPPSWIDRLPQEERVAVRRAIRGLEAAGVRDAEGLVQRDHEGIGPAVVTRLVESRLQAIVDELPERARPGGRELIGRVVALLTAEGVPRDGLPGWWLVEIGPEPEPPNRRITIRELRD
jgi:hypothetical protein